MTKAKTTSLTKAQLVEQIDKLKEQLRGILAEKKKNSELESGLPAFAPFKKDGHFKIANIEFDPETMQAKVVSIEDASRNTQSFELAEFECRKRLVELFNGFNIHE